MTYLSSLTASQGMVTWMYSAVLAARCPSDYCSNPDCVTDVFGVSTSVFGGLRNGQWRLYECDDHFSGLSSAAVTWCFSSTVGHKDSPSTPANFLPYLWPSFSSRTPRCIPSSQKSCHILLRTEGKRICDFLPPWSWKRPPNTSMASQGYLLFNTSGLK